MLGSGSQSGSDVAFLGGRLRVLSIELAWNIGRRIHRSIPLRRIDILLLPRIHTLPELQPIEPQNRTPPLQKLLHHISIGQEIPLNVRLHLSLYNGSRNDARLMQRKRLLVPVQGAIQIPAKKGRLAQGEVAVKASGPHELAMRGYG